MWKYIAGTVVVGSVTYGLMKYFAGGVCSCSTRLDGLVVIITGANSGIGRALAFELAKRGATLILACRSIDRGIQVKREIQAKLKVEPGRIYVKELDLNSFDSVAHFAYTVDNEFKDVYAVVNNAGVFYHPHRLTKDGYDITFQTNYLGPFLLTHLLLRTLKRAEHARIINVTSEGHRMVNAYDLNCITNAQSEFRTHFIAYGVSKLALILFTREFAKKLSNTNIIINAVNPGNTETAIFRYFPQLNNKWLYYLQWPIRLLVVKSPHQGIQSIVHALTTPNRSTGQYISDCKFILPSSVACNDKIASEYYHRTLEIIHSFITESEC